MKFANIGNSQKEQRKVFTHRIKQTLKKSSYAELQITYKALILEIAKRQKGKTKK